MNIDITKPWYSPAYIIHAEADLVKIYGQAIIDSDTTFQKVGEMKCTAIMLLGLHKVLGQHFFIQACDDQFPDAWTLYQEEVPGKLVDTKYQTVEVVTYENHSTIPDSEFILKHKLINPKKAYDEETVILCYIRKEGTYIYFNLLHKEFKKHKFKPTRVFIVGNMIKNPQTFTLTQVWPEIHQEDIDYVERTKVYPLPHRITFTKGLPRKVNYGGKRIPSKPNIYEPFHLNEAVVKKKYPNK